MIGWNGCLSRPDLHCEEVEGIDGDGYAMNRMSREAPPLVAIHFTTGDAVDAALGRFADALRGRGLRVVGHLQVRGSELNGDCNCRDMHLRDLASGDLVRISEDRGPEARGCHLDWQALTDLALTLEANLEPGSDELPDVLIVNRYGRSEAEGKGLRGAIEKGLEAGVQVFVAVREGYADAWAEFHAGLAVDAPDLELETLMALATPGAVAVP